MTEKTGRNRDIRVPNAGPRSGVPFRIATFETLAEGLDYAARGSAGCGFFSSRGELSESLSYAEIRERAIDLALRLSATGIERGSRVALIAETTPDFLVFFHACQYAGLIPTPLPLSINVGGHDAHVVRLRGMLSAAKPVLAVASKALLPTLTEAAAGLGLSMIGTPADYYGLSAEGGSLRPLGKHEPCYIQYSSGSTTQPRGVLVTQRAITANARSIGRDGLKLRPDDRACSWLPMYHDMGLVGFCLTPMLSQVPIDYLATSTFAVRPRLWLKVMSQRQSTISFSPTFGYELCVRRAARGNGLAELDLSHWRVAGIGGEMVRADVLEQFAETFAACGFDRRAFLPSYGLAEATLAVSFTELGDGIRVDTVDREKYERTGRAVPVSAGNDTAPRSRSFVKCGRQMPGYAIEVRDDEERPLPDRAIGRICIQGPSLMGGYYRNVEATRKVILADGWLDTGDMGYMIDGELVVTGRRKDMIICNGRNIWPQDLEWAVETVEGVRSGCAAAFSVTDADDSESVVVVVECYFNDAERQHSLMREISAVIHKSAGVHCEVVLVPARSLVFTSSGKLSRSAAKEQYLSGAVRLLANTFAGDFVDDDQPLAVACGE